MIIDNLTITAIIAIIAISLALYFACRSHRRQ